jgi:uncharacterized protein (DUF1697 family)
VLNTLGLCVRCLVWSGDELRRVIAHNPLRTVATDGSKMLMLFLSDPHLKLLEGHDPTELARDHIRVGERVIYQMVPGWIPRRSRCR